MNKSLNGFPLAPSLGAATADEPAGNAAAVVFSAIAGTDIKANDALLITQAGTVMPVERVESAAGREIASINFQMGQGYPTKRRNQVVIDPETGDIYFVAGYDVSNGVTCGLMLARITPRAGGNESERVSDDPNPLLAARLFWLSNGNLCVVWDTGTDKFQFAVYTKDLIRVVAPTIIGALGLSGYFDATPLAGGGFAVCYIAGTDQKLAIYGNNGVQVGATATVVNWTTGASNYQVRCSLAQLSNGNIAIACVLPNDLGKGVWVGVRDAAGAHVAFISRIYQPPGAQSEINPEIAAVDGFFAVASTDTANTKLWVFNNAGALQGAPYTSNVGNGAVANSIRLLADGGDFWLVGQRAISPPYTAAWTLTRAKTNGLDYTTTDIRSTGTYKINNILPIDAFIHRGFLVAAQYRSTVTVDLSTTQAVWDEGNWLSSSSYEAPAIAHFGDFTAVVVATNGTTQTLGGYRQYLPSAIAGVASEDVPKGSEVKVKAGVGHFKVNPCKAGHLYRFTNFDQTANAAGSPSLSAGGGGMKGWIGPNNLFIRSL